MTAPEPWTCPACKARVATPFCPACGESPVRVRELSLRGLLVQAFHAFSNMDGRLMRSWRGLLARPGQLTAAYVEGQRKAYILPLQLFLLTNVLFFAAQSLTGVKVFSTTLDMHLHLQPWSAIAERLLANRLAATGRTLDAFAPLFDQSVALNAKSLIVLMVVPFALLPALLYRRTPRPFVAHIVFALHVYAFLLLLFCAASAAIATSCLFGGTIPASERLDHVVTIVELLICAAYLHVAVGTVYAAKGIARPVQALALTVSVAAIALGYRFALFLITLYTT